MKRLTHILIFSVVMLFTKPLFAEGIRSITIMPPTDTTGLNLSRDLQQHIGEYLYGTRQYVVQYSAHALTGFTVKDLYQTFERLDTQLILFPYVEPGRFSLFLFDSYRPQEFISASVPFTETKGTLTQQNVYDYFPRVYTALINAFSKGQYQLLPGGQSPNANSNIDDKELTRKQFRTIASMYSSSSYAGANVGVVRLSANAKNASTVNLSAYYGLRMNDTIALELGVDAFSYFFPNARLRYKLPFMKNKFPSIDLTLSAGSVLGVIAEQRGFASSNIKTGSFLFGAGLGLSVPLGQAFLLCDLRFYMGAGSLFFGNYGIAFPL